jgi:hypothetical protein
VNSEPSKSGLSVLPRGKLWITFGTRRGPSRCVEHWGLRAWGRIRAEIVWSMTSNYVIALYASHPRASVHEFALTWWKMQSEEFQVARAGAQPQQSGGRMDLRGPDVGRDAGCGMVFGTTQPSMSASGVHICTYSRLKHDYHRISVKSPTPLPCPNYRKTFAAWCLAT